MSNYHVKYLLVGGGVASSAAAEAIRAIDPEGAIVLVSQEIVRPYHRPPLSKAFLRHEKSREELFTHEGEWFHRHHIELRTGHRAAHLDVMRSAVTLDNGEVIAYDNLLLASGMAPRLLDVPGAEMPNLFYVRSLEDIYRLHKAIEKAMAEGRPHSPGDRAGPRGRAAIIGGGLLGVELAGSFTQMGLRVDLLCARAYPWDRYVGEITGKAVSSFLEKRGVHVYASSRPARLEGDGRVQRVVLGDDSSIECDFAVAAIGGVVHRELLRGTPIAAETAVLTDVHCRTNIPNIYAAGDCAAVFDPLFAKHRVLDHWDHAVITGGLAGRNMAGMRDAYATVNHFFSNVFELTLNGWGEAKKVDRRIVRGGRIGNVAPPEILEIGIASDGRVAQVLALGHRDAPRSAKLAELVARRVNTAGLEEKLKDPAVPIEALLAQ